MHPVEPITNIVVPSSASRSRWMGPSLALLLLSPIISEVLYGATRLSVIFVVIPEIMTWGCAALLIRECVRRWKKGWPSMLLLGLALAIAEEWVIQQTSIAPLVGLAQHAYGRVWGVNWVYFLWALVYESVWVVLVPVHLTELLFPEKRDRCWLRTRGLIIAGAVFIVGAFMAWYGWTQRARVKIFHMPPYSPPPVYIVGGLAMVAILILAAYLIPAPESLGNAAPTTAPSPRLVGTVTTVLGSVWGAYVLFGFGSFPAIPFVWALAGGLGLSALALVFFAWWTRAHDWDDAHQFAAVFGGILACSLGGFVVFKIGGALRIDWIGKVVFDATAIGWLLLIRHKVVRVTP